MAKQQLVFLMVMAFLLSALPASADITYVYTPEQDAGSVSYTFWIDYPGNYILEASVRGLGSSHDSFYVGIDGQNVQGVNDYIYAVPVSSSFVWDDISLQGWSDDPKLWYLSSGAHTFTFYGMETDARIDKLVLNRDQSECDCGSYSDDACGAGNCGSGQMRQTRSCDPAGCDQESRCVDSSSCQENNWACTPYTEEDCSLSGTGLCASGKRTCTADGQWSSCTSEGPKTEVCGNSVDEDCDGTLNNGCEGVCDTDNDGHEEFFWCAGSKPNDDCDDDNAAVHPGATEVCGNSVDEDCDGVIASCDNTPPTVSIDSPSDGAAYIAPATVKITAYGSDPDGYVAKMRFYEGSDVLLYEDTSAPWEYTWNDVSEGQWNIRVKAYDDDGATDESQVTIHVDAPACIDDDTDGYGKWGRSSCPHPGTDCDDSNVKIHPGANDICGNGVDEDCNDGDAVCANKNPTVHFTSPSDGDRFPMNTQITLKADASDSDGSISKVHFYDEADTFSGYDYSAPYSYTFTAYGGDELNLRVRAYDDDGATAIDMISIEITECSPGAKKSCSTGLKGVCSAGTQTCSTYGSWSACAQNTEASTEDCQDDKDNDCDGYTDMDDSTCQGICDTDGDGYDEFFWCTGNGPNTDCNDDRSDINPGRTEICGNGVDDDCSGGDANCAPTVHLESPSYYATYTENDKVHMKAEASDSDGSISKVYFYVDGSNKYGDSSKDSNGYYTYTWTAYGIGDHTLKVKSKDDAGAYSGYDSQKIKVTAYGTS
ncbi:MAG: hypothetical protein GXP63_05585 [DPANN group archaeon]|nr:hypothetical protein [DPANN group archaeon]